MTNDEALRAIESVLGFYAPLQQTKGVLLAAKDAMKVIEDKEKILSGKQTDLDRLTRETEKTQERLKQLLPDLEAGRQNANAEMSALQAKHAQWEKSNDQRRNELRADADAMERTYLAAKESMQSEIATLNQKVQTAREQHTAFVEKLAGAGR